MNNLSDYILEKLSINKDTEVREKTDDPSTWSEGDILVTIGGYNMILVDFYKIIKATGKSFKVKELKKKNKDIDLNIFRALDNVNLNCVIGYKKDKTFHSFLEDYDKEE